MHYDVRELRDAPCQGVARSRGTTFRAGTGSKDTIVPPHFRIHDYVLE